MKALLFVGAMIWAAAAAAAPVPVVKLASYRCDAPSSYRSGSGVLVRKDGRLLLLSAAHVPFHGGRAEGICHVLWKEGQGTYAAEFLGANYFKDLALFEVPGGLLSPLDKSAVDLADLRPRPPVGAQISVVGYPVAASAPVFYPAQLLAIAGNGLPPLLVPTLAAMSLSEYGMSGGAVLGPQGAVYGIVSRQVLIGAPVPPMVVATAAVDTAHWVDAALNQEEGALAPLDLAAQLAGRVSLSVAGRSFTEDRCGGDGTPAADGGECRITVALAEASPQAAWPLQSSAAIEPLSALLTANAPRLVSVLKLAGKEVRPQSILHLFLLLDAGYTPVTAPYQGWAAAGTVAIEHAASGRWVSFPFAGPQVTKRLAVVYPLACDGFSALQAVAVWKDGAAAAEAVQLVETKIEKGLVYQQAVVDDGRGAALTGIALKAIMPADRRCDYRFATLQD